MLVDSKAAIDLTTSSGQGCRTTNQMARHNLGGGHDARGCAVGYVLVSTLDEIEGMRILTVNVMPIQACSVRTPDEIGPTWHRPGISGRVALIRAAILREGSGLACRLW